MHKIDQRKKLNTFGDFENKTPTHIDTTHAISNSEQQFQIGILRDLDQTFYRISGLYIPGFVINHLISFNFWK